jgi:hypothetical protein
MASDHIRASDRDRDAVVGALRDAYAEGRLSLEEFQERTTAAYAGRTWGDLRELTTDLPVQPALGADLPAPLPGPQPGPVARQGPVAQPGTGIQPGPGAPYPEHPPFSGRPLYPGQPPYPYEPPDSGQPLQPGQPLEHSQPPGPPQRRRTFGPLLPVVGMWVLFALALRSDGGAIAFLVVVVLLAMLASGGRHRGGRR